MIQFINKVLKSLANYKFITSGIWTAVILYLSLGKFPKPENIEELIPFTDKIVHFMMYFILSTLLFFEFRIAKFYYKSLFIIIYTILLGVLMELLQSELFEYRTGDIKDVIFNFAGTVSGYFFFRYSKFATKQ